MNKPFNRRSKQQCFLVWSIFFPVLVWFQGKQGDTPISTFVLHLCLKESLLIQLFKPLFKVLLSHMPTQAPYTHSSLNTESMGRNPQGSRLEDKSAIKSKIQCWTQIPYFLLKIKSLWFGQAWLPPFFFPQKAFSPRKVPLSSMQWVGSAWQGDRYAHTCLHPRCSTQARP